MSRRSFDFVKSWSKPPNGQQPLTTYAAIWTAYVAEDVLTAAKMATLVACTDLGLDVPKLVWFEESTVEIDGGHTFTRPAVRGVADQQKHAIGIDADLTKAEAAETAAHECRHLAQSTFKSDPDREDEAARYGQTIAHILDTNALLYRSEPTIYRGRDVAPNFDQYGSAPKLLSARRGDLVQASAATYIKVGGTPDWRRLPGR